MRTAPTKHATTSPTSPGVPVAGRRVGVLLCVAGAFTVLLAAFAGYMWWVEATYTGESMGVGYVLAVLAGVPALVALVLSVAAAALRHRRAGAAVVLAWFAVATAVAPVAFYALMALPVVVGGM